MRRSILPLHDICSALGDELVKCLPAVHALTGCNTTSKVATKSAALNAIQKPGNSSLVLVQLSTANRKINTGGGDILGQMSQTNNRPRDI